MLPPIRTVRAAVLGIALLPFFAGLAVAGGAVQNQVSIYTGPNAVGYLQPLANAFGAALNSSFSYSAYIPKASFHISLEAPVMGVIFEDADRTFNATTESGFSPSTTARVPTAVGDGAAVTVPGNGGTSFSFPGGLDLNSFGLVVPQLRIGALLGSEALVRWVAYQQGGVDIGRVSMFGLGARHSLSQYMGPSPPVDLSLGAMWQKVDVGDNGHGGDFVRTDAFSMQLQASKRAPLGFLVFEPYAGVAWEKFSADLSYDDTNGNLVDVSLDGGNDVRFTLGAGFNFVIGHVWADYNFAHTDNFSLGLALGNQGRGDPGKP
jgi:hypothetical protein